ncbi:NADP:D-xylose dehydrogenase [Apiospora aurea]|uniref:NADP:D-xylose dehydrogenase n=1 Tax=Apiospora aurea TaxID=335848 RepID=A0ABR1Q9T2_9PEZI
MSPAADSSVKRTLPSGELSLEDSHRMINPSLGGGAMLDLGIYSLTWIMQILYHSQPPREEAEEKETEKERPHVVAAVDKHPRTGVDEMASFIVHFPERKAMGIGMAGLRVAAESTGGPAVRIQGSAGEIQVLGPAFKPHAFRVVWGGWWHRQRGRHGGLFFPERPEARGLGSWDVLGGRRVRPVHSGWQVGERNPAARGEFGDFGGYGLGATLERSDAAVAHAVHLLQLHIEKMNAVSFLCFQIQSSLLGNPNLGKDTPAKSPRTESPMV